MLDESKRKSLKIRHATRFLGRHVRFKYRDSAYSGDLISFFSTALLPHVVDRAKNYNLSQLFEKLAFGMESSRAQQVSEPSDNTESPDLEMNHR